MTGPADDMLWARMMTLFATARDAMFSILARHGLTPPHGFAITMLHDGPMRMSDMAARMTCDASYVTAIVDRLEEVGLAVRRTSPTDRRVKEIDFLSRIRHQSSIRHDRSLIAALPNRQSRHAPLGGWR